MNNPKNVLTLLVEKFDNFPFKSTITTREREIADIIEGEIRLFCDADDVVQTDELVLDDFAEDICKEGQLADDDVPNSVLKELNDSSDDEHNNAKAVSRGGYFLKPFRTLNVSFQWLALVQALRIIRHPHQQNENELLLTKN